jgi:hypothetical protein
MNVGCITKNLRRRLSAPVVVRHGLAGSKARKPATAMMRAITPSTGDLLY